MTATRWTMLVGAALAGVSLAGCGAGKPAACVSADAGDATTGGADAAPADTATADAATADAASTDGGGTDAPAARCLPADAPGMTAAPPPPTCRGETAEFSPDRPLGIGFPDGADLLPPHVAYLTFDDGPSDWTGEVLDMLAADDVRATFFVNAKNLKGASGLDGSYLDAAGNPAVFRDLLARAVDAGHALGNHTVDHKDLAALSAADAQAQLDENERLVNVALARAGRPTRPLTLVRPPFGSPWYHHAPLPPDQVAAEIAVAAVVADRGIEVLWTIDSTDSYEWAQGESFTRRPGQITPAANAPTYADKVARIQTTVLTDPAILAGGGAVILLHDTHNATRDALPAIIHGLRAAGYSFATMEDYAVWRWGHPSAELTPGPSLYDACTPDGDWGCAFAGSGSTAGARDRARAVCGRFWRAYQEMGADAVVGAPLAAPGQRPSGTPFQAFANGVIELHPELAPPCNVQLLAPLPSGN